MLRLVDAGGPDDPGPPETRAEAAARRRAERAALVPAGPVHRRSVTEYVTRETLGISVATVARWAQLRKRAVDRFELDQGGEPAEVARLVPIYKGLSRLLEEISGNRPAAP